MRATVILALAASVMAYRVITPSDREGEGWECNTPNKVTWQKVSSDPRTCSLVLRNQDRDTLARSVVLARVVNGTDRSATIQPPSEGWPEGSNFRVNMEDKDGGIFAQSNPFKIECLEPEPDSDSKDTTPTPKTPATSGSKSESKSGKASDTQRS